MTANAKYRITIALLLLALVLPACRFSPLGNLYRPVGTQARVPLHRQNPGPFALPKTGMVMVGLACSGGGSRAAYLTAAILGEIQHSRLKLDLPGDSGDATSLLGQMDFVSAVSGGSLAATYFVANVETLTAGSETLAWRNFLDKMAIDFRRRQWYGHALLNPLTWLKALFTNYNRGHIARDHYDAVLYRGATLASLPARPALYINAFDVGNRVRFVFSKHYIDNGYYEEGAWGNMPDRPQPLTRENDLPFVRVSPESVRLADAVYASSAFPFVYPNLPLEHFGSKVVFQGQRIFLADGGLADNSGLLTLLTLMKVEVDHAPATRFVVALRIDASLEGVAGTTSPISRRDSDYAWKGTYLRHGVESVSGAVDQHQAAVLLFLEETGVVVDTELLNYATKLVRPPTTGATSRRASWAQAFHEQLLLRPVIIGLRLRHVFDAYYRLWTRFSADPATIDPRFVELLEANGIKEDFTASFPIGRVPASRLAAIETDFVLSDENRALLDLTAYVLVHGKLAPALAEWNRLAIDRLRETMPRR